MCTKNKKLAPVDKWLGNSVIWVDMNGRRIVFFFFFTTKFVIKFHSKLNKMFSRTFYSTLMPVPWKCTLIEENLFDPLSNLLCLHAVDERVPEGQE